MKTILLLLLSLSLCHADFMQDRALKDAGPKPEVTQDALPDTIKNGIREKLKDPDSVEFIEWTLPELRQTTSGGKQLAWWAVRVTVRAKNSYGGYVVEKWSVSVKNGRVERATSR